MEFKHFKPIDSIRPKSVTPNFTDWDVNSPLKNIPHLEEIALTGGIVSAKGLILANTFKAQKIGKDAMLTKLGTGQLGFPIYSNLFIQGGSYQDNSGQTIGKYDDITLNAVLMEVEREKNIIQTDIQGRNGSVFEYIGTKSPKIKIIGTILNEAPGIYPRKDVENLAIALGSNRPLIVVSWFLQMLGISYLIVNRDSIKQEEGSQEYQKFEFDAMADLPIVLKLSPQNKDNLNALQA